MTNKTPKAASGSGIFITFTADGCYDSDYQGYTNDKSYLKLAVDGKYKIYNGTTYWGIGDYKFTPDLSRLNIVVDDKVYAYKRVAKPSGIRNSTYVGQARSSGGHTTNSVPNANMYGGYSSGTNDNGGMSAEWYQETYNRYARTAESIYNSITTTFRDSKGNEVSGHVYSPADSQVAISGMINNFRKVQRDMRDLRQEARRNGHQIAKSYYEDADIKWL